jgi:hypothetical protein
LPLLSWDKATGAEKLISEELADKDKQLKMIEDILEDSKLK